MNIWTLDNGQWLQLTTLRHPQVVEDCWFSSNARHLLTISATSHLKGQMRIWSFSNNSWNATIINEFDCSFHHHPSYALSHNQRHLVTRANSNTIQIWSFHGGQVKEKRKIENISELATIIFSPDGNRLATTSCDNSVIIFNISGENCEIETTIKHSAEVSKIAFNPDGTRIVTASDDGTVKICKFIDEQWKKENTTHCMFTTEHISFTPDGSHLITIMSDEYYLRDYEGEHCHYFNIYLLKSDENRLLNTPKT